MANQKWNFELSHSIIGFSARHMMITQINDRFKSWSGTLEFETTVDPRDHHVARRKADDAVGEIEVPFLICHRRCSSKVLRAAPMKIGGPLKVRRVARDGKGAQRNAALRAGQRGPALAAPLGQRLEAQRERGQIQRNLRDFWLLALGQRVDLRVDLRE